MSTALFAFDEPAAAHRAAERLRERGVPTESLQLHLPATSSADRAAAAVDEQATGGLLTNVAGLFGQVFEWGSLPIDTSAYSAAVRRGGAVIGVDAGSDAERATVDTAMEEAHPAMRSEWFDPAGQAEPASKREP